MREVFEKWKGLKQNMGGRIIEFLPRIPRHRQLAVDAARELGIRTVGVELKFKFQVQRDHFFDFFLFESPPAGAPIAQQFLDATPDLPEEERELVERALESTTSLYEIVEKRPADSVIVLRNLLEPEAPFPLWDSGLSITCMVGALLFTRAVHVGGISMTSSAGMGFPVEFKPFLLSKYEKVRRVKNPILRARKRYVFFHEQSKTSPIHLVAH